MAKKKTSARVAKIAGRILESAKAIKKKEPLARVFVIDVNDAITLAASVLSQTEPAKKAKAKVRKCGK